MRRSVPVRAVCVALVLLALSGVCARVAAQPALLRSFTIKVVDQFGYARSDAVVAIRDKADYGSAHRYTTDDTGCIRVNLDPTHWYVVEITYSEFGSGEYWAYGYVQDSDWSSGALKVFQRKEPWIDQVTVTQDHVIPGQLVQALVDIDHGYTQMDFDLQVRVRMLIDDDLQQPWIDDQVSDIQIFYDGLEPFDLSYVPHDARPLNVRFQVERKYEQNDWIIADDSGWQWAVIVDPPPTVIPELTNTPTRSPEPTIPPTIHPTATVAPTVELGRMLWLPILWIGQ